MEIQRIPENPIDFRAARQKFGLTLKDVEFETGIPISTQSKIDNGVTERPSYADIVKLNNFFYDKLIASTL